MEEAALGLGLVREAGCLWAELGGFDLGFLGGGDWVGPGAGPGECVGEVVGGKKAERPAPADCWELGDCLLRWLHSAVN